MKVSEMSKFIERLQQVMTPSVQSMGFMTAKAQCARPKIQLVLNVNASKAKTQIKEAAGADALLFSNGAVDCGETVTGMRLVKGDAEEVEKAVKAGADFVVLPLSGEVLAPDKKVGKIIQIEDAITDIMLRTVSDLPADAVLLMEDKENSLSLTWKRLMLIRKFASLSGKPLLIEVLASVKETELQQIWDAGVSGVVVRIDAEQAEAAAANLRQIIEKLTFPSKQKNGKNMAIVPAVTVAAEAPKEDDDDDDDDDE
jgi:thiamine monophosphate synthase